MMVQFIAMYWLLTKYHEKYPLVLGQAYEKGIYGSLS